MSRDGYYAREHTVDFGTVPAASEPVDPRHPHRLADAWVGIDSLETCTPIGSIYEPPAVMLGAEFWPRFTAAEARQVAALLTAAADRLDAIKGGE